MIRGIHHPETARLIRRDQKSLLLKDRLNLYKYFPYEIEYILDPSANGLENFTVTETGRILKVHTSLDTMYYMDDSANTWSSVTLGGTFSTTNYPKVIRSRKNVIVVAGQAGRIGVSTNNGASFSSETLPSTPGNISMLDGTLDGVNWIAASSTKAWKNTASGAGGSWVNMATNASGFNAICILPDASGNPYALGGTSSQHRYAALSGTAFTDYGSTPTFAASATSFEFSTIPSKGKVFFLTTKNTIGVNKITVPITGTDLVYIQSNISRVGAIFYDSIDDWYYLIPYRVHGNQEYPLMGRIKGSFINDLNHSSSSNPVQIIRPGCFEFIPNYLGMYTKICINKAIGTVCYWNNNIYFPGEDTYNRFHFFYKLTRLC